MLQFNQTVNQFLSETETVIEYWKLHLYACVVHKLNVHAPVQLQSGLTIISLVAVT